MDKLMTTTAIGLIVGLGLGLASPGFAAADASGDRNITLGEYKSAGVGSAVQMAQQTEQDTEQNRDPATSGTDEPPAMGADKPPAMDADRPTTMGAETPAPMIPDAAIIGKDVVNQEGQNLGKVESLVVERGTTDQVHAVISVGGFLGIGDREIAVPLKDLEIGEENVTLMSQQTKEDLKAMPEYDENNYEAWRAPSGSAPTDGAKPLDKTP